MVNADQSVRTTVYAKRGYNGPDRRYTIINTSGVQEAGLEWAGCLRKVRWLQ